MPFKRISVSEANTFLGTHELTLIDIRDPQSYSAGHIEGALHITNDNVQEFVNCANKTQPLLIYCYHGNSSQGAADYFSSLGFEDCYSIDGGYEEWKQIL